MRRKIPQHRICVGLCMLPFDRLIGIHQSKLRSPNEHSISFCEMFNSPDFSPMFISKKYFNFNNRAYQILITQDPRISNPYTNKPLLSCISTFHLHFSPLKKKKKIQGEILRYLFFSPPFSIGDSYFNNRAILDCFILMFKKKKNSLLQFYILDVWPRILRQILSKCITPTSNELKHA